jgi:hypothetical protein
MRAAHRVAQVDLGIQRVVGDDASEQIGRDAADEPRRGAKPRHANGDVETGSPGNRNSRVAPVSGCDRKEINQRISANQQHGLAFRFRPSDR